MESRLSEKYWFDSFISNKYIIINEKGIKLVNNKIFVKYNDVITHEQVRHEEQLH